MLPAYGGHLVSHAFLASRDAAPIAPAVRAEFRALAARFQRLGPASSPRAILEVLAAPLIQLLGFDACECVETTGHALVATVRAVGEPVVLLVAPWGERLDPYWRPAVAEAQRRGADWAILINGPQLRIVHAGRLYSRRFASFDLPVALEQSTTAAALVQLVSAQAIGTPVANAASLLALIAASDRHAAGVRQSLRSGVLSASGDLLQALVSGDRRSTRIPIDDSFEQALTIVYRILFLLFAEARALVPLWHPVYRDSYSIESLRDLAEGSDPAIGLWDALRAIARLAHAGCRAGDLAVTPFNGRLFAPGRTPLAERRNLDDAAAQRAVLALSTRPAIDRAGRERIIYRDLGVEQLGAVYETLLDYRPHLTPGSRSGVRVTLEAGSSQRKTTGTFYTPQPIAEHIVRQALEPLVRDATPDDVLSLRVLDPAMGSGAFLVAACRYLAEAYERALVMDGRRSGDIDAAERASIRRRVAEHCLYGVDVNPMAVQLARLSLWLATLAADRPLSFLDHRLVAGNSLLGAWLSQLRRPPARTRSEPRVLPLFTDEGAPDAVRDALPIRFSLEQTPNDTLDHVRAKERAFSTLTAHDGTLARWKRVADAWCAAWFGDKATRIPAHAFTALSDAVLSGASALPDKTVARYLDHAAVESRSRRFFHWELEFPEVFFDANGQRLARPGFDAIIGNPPWEMLRGAEHGARESDAASIVRFSRESGAYRAQSDGHANLYQLFLERVMDLTRAAGRFGLLLPSGLATDVGSGALRRELFSRCDVDLLAGLDNRRRIFPIHRSLRFIVLSATSGGSTLTIPCRFGADAPTALDRHPDSPPVHVTTDLLFQLSGPSLAIPNIRNTCDVAIMEKAAARFPVFGSDRGWAARFGRELNATDDRSAFHASPRGLPVLDGKHLEPFRRSPVPVSRFISASDAARRVSDRRFARPRLAYRDVASATNRVTLIAAVLPANCVSTHTLFCLRTVVPCRDQQLLCGVLNSLVVNYLVRLRVGTHVTTAIVEQLPIPTRATDPAQCQAITRLACRLARGHDAVAFAALNARVATLYGLTDDEMRYILSTFPLVDEGEKRLIVEELRRANS